MSSGLSFIKAGIILGIVGILITLAISLITLIKVVNNTNTADDENILNYFYFFNNTECYNYTEIRYLNESNPNEILNIYLPNKSNTAKFQEAAKYFADSIDTSVNPCDDFYKYACGNYKNDVSFNIAEFDNYRKMAEAYNIENNKDVSLLSTLD